MKKDIIKIYFVIMLIIVISLLININSFAMLVETKEVNKLALTSEQIIENGTYSIKSALDEQYVLDIGGASKTNGGNIQIWKNVFAPQQKFVITYLGGGNYSLSSVNSGKMMDVAGGSLSDGANVQQWESNSTPAQKWIIKDAGNGYYYIVSALSNFYLTVANGVAQNGTNIQVNKENQLNSQKFKLEKEEKMVGTQSISDGTYTIKSASNEQYVLDVGGASKFNGGNIQLWANSYVPQQRFKAKYIGAGMYSLESVNSGKMMDVTGGSLADGTNVQQWESNNTLSQRWIIKDTGDGYYYIISALNNLYLTANGINASNGVNIQINIKKEQVELQKFKMEKDEPVVGAKTVEEGIYTIKSALNEQYVLDVAGASLNNGGNIQLWSGVNVAQQKYNVKYIGGGYYTVTSLKSNKVLDVTGGSLADGTNVQQWESNNTLSQKWIIKDAGNGYYYIISGLSNLYLTANGANAENGTNIQVNIGNFSNMQKFRFTTTIIGADLDTSKYPGYKEKIDNLALAHPNWNFKFLYTGIKFNDAVNGEASVPARNLVPTSYAGEWINGYTLYDSGWYPASAKAIAYYMDPRNFLDDVNIFQFQDENGFPAEITVANIQTEVNNTYLANYASDIYTACKNQGVNPYYIISRLIQEQGKNGTTIGKGMDGGDGKTYYNPFDIGASGNGYTEIYANALATAKNYGWDSMEKAIEGGITFCKKNWLDNYQNTLYQNRFDIDSTNGTALYSHQYMQNLMGAYSEAKMLEQMYVNTGAKDSTITFIIPLYEQMSSTVSPLPSNNVESYPMDFATTGSYIRLRESPNGAIICELPEKGTKLISAQRGINSDWQKVITVDGKIGYVSSQYLTAIDIQTNCNYKATIKTNDGQGCYSRIGPSTSLDILAGVSEGTTVTVINKETYNNINGYNWYRIILPSGAQGFIASQFLI